MSAINIYENAPLGSLIRYRDSQPKPPEGDQEALAAWEQRNSVGWLVRRKPPRQRAHWSSSAAITLQGGDFSMDLDVSIAARRDFPLDSGLSFLIVTRPVPGNIRLLQEYADNSILLFLAENRLAADRWLEESGHINVRAEEVTADEVCADVVEGRVS